MRWLKRKKKPQTGSAVWADMSAEYAQLVEKIHKQIEEMGGTNE